MTCPVSSVPLLIFDCDGVLVDSEGIALSVLSDMMAENGRPMDVAACRDAFMGRHSDDIVAGIERRLGRALAGGAAGMRERMIGRLRAELRPVAGVAEMLARLDGPRCVASSSDPGRIRLTLALTGLDTLFADEAIFSGTEVAHGKPAPDIFLHAAERMRFRPVDCVVVEDSPLGVVAAVAAGMRVVGFTGGSHTDPGHAARLAAAGAAPVIDSADALPALIERWRS